MIALIIVYLGGSLGVQAWLMKGFFDTIPTELDESARVDGATPAQIFWGVILPLAAPVLAVVALISFVFTLNEFVLASALLQTNKHFTLPVGLYGFINQNYGQHWGPFAAGVLMARDSGRALFLFLQRWIVSGLTAGCGQGMTIAGVDVSATLLAEPHHDGSDLYVARAAGRARRRGGRPRCACRARRRRPRAPALRARRRAAERRGDGRRGDRDATSWWRAEFPLANPVTRYRWLLSGGNAGYAWVNGARPHAARGRRTPTTS